MKAITVVLVIMSVLFGLVGLAAYIIPLLFVYVGMDSYVNKIALSVGLIGGGLMGFAALLAIYARIAQAASHLGKGGQP